MQQMIIYIPSKKIYFFLNFNIDVTIRDRVLKKELSNVQNRDSLKSLLLCIILIK